MGPKTPKKIEEKILRLWLSGLPRHEISEKAGVSIGTILNSVKEAKKNVPDVVLLRELAVKIRKKGWNLDIFSSAVRHQSMLYERSITDEQIDELIEEIDEHCFKKGIPIPSFLRLLHTVSLMSIKYGVPVENLNELTTDMEMHLMELEDKFADLEESYSEMLKRNNMTEREIEQIRQDRPLINTINRLRQENDDLKMNIAGRQLDEAAKVSKIILNLPTAMTEFDVNKATNALLVNPSQWEKVIRYILKKIDSLPNNNDRQE
jgi:hypothetical protein